VRRIYLDHASTTPLRPAARVAIAEVLDGPFGDPSRLHEEGRLVRDVVETGRDQVAAFFGVTPRQVIFTSGASESIHHANWSAQVHKKGVVALAPVEHSSVVESARRFADVIDLDVDGFGRINFEATTVGGSKDVPISLVHCQFGNHEVATLQPVEEAGAFARRNAAWLHIDAACAAGHIPLHLNNFEWDLISVSSHELGGPAGVGALIIRRGLRLAPFFIGSQQERARRAGFENVIGIVGFGAALASLDEATLADESAKAKHQSDLLVSRSSQIGGVTQVGDPTHRLPHIICLGIEGIEAEPVLMGLDRKGVAVHSGSACSAESLEPSPILAAMGVDPSRSLRLSVGWTTTDDDVERFAPLLDDVVANLRELRGSL